MVSNISPETQVVFDFLDNLEDQTNARYKLMEHFNLQYVNANRFFEAWEARNLEQLKQTSKSKRKKSGDDLTKKGPEDSRLISLNEKWEVDYWTKALGLSEEKLKEAVLAAGHSAKAVRQWLKDNK